jgi:hypothetical protein
MSSASSIESRLHCEPLTLERMLAAFAPMIFKNELFLSLPLFICCEAFA